MRCTGYEMARYKSTQANHLYEKSMHTLCTIQWATAPGQSLNYPRPKSITHRQLTDESYKGCRMDGFNQSAFEIEF